MSHHGLQVLYSLMNVREDWACERVFTPLPDFEKALREHEVPLYSLETFTPLKDFDVLGFSLQYEISYTNLLTMLDLGGIALHAEDRGDDETLVIAGGPGTQNPELLAPFVDLFVIGDGEPSLPVVCDLWARDESARGCRARTSWRRSPAAFLGVRAPFLRADLRRRRRSSASSGLRDDVPEAIRPCVIADLDGDPPADQADHVVRRNCARPDRDRDHARLPLAVPILPKHRHQAADPVSLGRDDRQRGA